MFGHGNSFYSLGKAFWEAGWNVKTMDFRGHGLSEGIPGTIEDANICQADMKKLINTSSSSKLVIGGYSYGSLLCSQLIAKNTVKPDGFFLINPSLYYDNSLLSPKNALSRLINSVSPGTSVSRNPFEKPPKYFFSDPRNFKKKWTAGMTCTALDTIETYKLDANKISVPTFLISGKKDTLIPEEHSIRFFDSLNTENKVFLSIEG